MRKLFGLLIVIVAAVFLGLAYSELAHAEDANCASPPSSDTACDSVLANKIVELLKEDQSNLLDTQYDLTVLKLAREAMGSAGKTIESHIREQEEVLKRLEKVEANKDVRDELIKLYVNYGKLSDLEKIDLGLDQLAKDAVLTEEQTKTAVEYRLKKAEAPLQDTVDKAKSANYYRISKTGDKSKDLRFRNRDLSAYVQAHMIVKKDKTYVEGDAAILWFKAQISEGIEAEKGRGNRASNLAETSTRVAQLTGVAGTKGATPEEINILIDAQEKAIATEFDRITVEYADKLKTACKAMETCADCGVKAAENQISSADRQSALAKAIRAVSVDMQKCDAVREAKIQEVLAEFGETGAKPVLEVKSTAPSETIAVVKDPVVTDAEVKANTDKLIAEIRNGVALPPMPNIFTRDPKTGKDLPPPTYYAKPFGECNARYFVTGGRVSFQVVTKFGKLACSASFDGMMAFKPEGMWNADLATQACRNRKNGLDVKRVCAETASP